MAKGSVAKDKVFAALEKAFGESYIGIVDKKAYLWVDDGGEKVQIAVALTKAKNPVGVVTPSTGGFNFDDDAPAPIVAQTKFEPAEITQEEEDNISEMMKKLGLI